MIDDGGGITMFIKPVLSLILKRAVGMQLEKTGVSRMEVFYCQGIHVTRSSFARAE